MSAPFRIEKRRPTPVAKGPKLANQPPDPNAGFKEYLQRLIKMIPGEIVGLYMIGSGFIPKGEPLALVIWSVVCLILLIALRIWGTADPVEGKPSQPIPVFISAVAFVIWLYWLGGPFSAYPEHNLHIDYVGSLLVLVWSFIVPLIYKGS
jgi:hypothetical protein